MSIDLAAEWSKRPWWMNLVLLFCLFMVFIYSPFDVLLKPVAEDEDVWFGYMFYCWAAKVGGVIHLLVYAAIAWGLWVMKPWGWWVASLYATQVALAMFLWPVLQQQPSGLMGGLIAGGIFAIPAIAFWLSRNRFSA